MPDYELIRSNRRTIAIQIKADGRVIVRAPLRMPQAQICHFVSTKEEWIQNHLTALRQHRSCALPCLTADEMAALAAQAKQDLPVRVARYASLLCVSYGRITIRAQKTRWGSCSTKGNLNLNCLLMLCPEEVRDYVVVHELCHRKQLNHSPAFWREVTAILPDYAQQRKWLRRHGSTLIARLP